MKYTDLTFEHFEKDFKSLKCSKTTRHDDIDSNIIIEVYDEINNPVFMILHSSFSKDIFLEHLNVTNFFRIFKVGNIEEVGKYR